MNDVNKIQEKWIFPLERNSYTWPSLLFVANPTLF